MANSFEELARKVAKLRGPDHGVDKEIAEALGYKTYAEATRIRMCGDGMLGHILSRKKENVPRFTRSLDAAHTLGKLTDPDVYVETHEAARIKTYFLLNVMHARGINPVNRVDGWKPKGIAVCSNCSGFVHIDANFCQRCGHARG